MHKVKCSKCGMYFDADKVPFIKTSARRYAHLQCDNEDPILVDKLNLELYIKKLFNIDTIPFVIGKQINDYIKQYNFTYSGIQKTLEYCFEIKKKNLQKDKETIGIVPYYYNEAKKYFYDIYLSQNANKDLNIKETIQYKNKEITISQPQSKKSVMKFMDF